MGKSKRKEEKVEELCLGSNVAIGQLDQNDATASQ